jgi:hypothetical protein
MTSQMMPDGFEEWREPGVRVFVTVDHRADERIVPGLEIGMGDDDLVVWMSMEEARWVIDRLHDALLAAGGARARRLKRLESARVSGGEVMSLSKERIAELRELVTQIDVAIAIDAPGAYELGETLASELSVEATELLDSAERVRELEAEGTRVEAYVVELQVQVRKLEAKLAAARELIDDLRGYCASWEYKYGEEWDEQRKALDE